jgi:acetylornithine deacetylase
MMKFSIDKNYLTNTSIELVQIDSRNPSLEPDGPGEIECAEYMAMKMRELGLSAKIYKISDKHANAVGVLKGKGTGKRLLLNAHMDTVGIAGMTYPFSGKLEKDRVYGRGSQDMKGSLAAMLAVVKTLKDNNITLDGDLIIAGVADEEYSSKGTIDLLKHYTADATIVTEPTNFSLVTAHRGFIWYEVETIGRAAHGSRYDIGIDANMHMGRFVAELDKLEQKLHLEKKHPLVGLPSLHASVINGGTDISTYSARCNLKIERRTVPGENPKEITAELNSIIKKLKRDDPKFEATVKTILMRSPYEVSRNCNIVSISKSVLENYHNKPCTLEGAPFWTDAAIFTDSGIDTVILGPVGDGLHAEEEWVDVNSLCDLTKILTEISVRFCRKNS